MGFSVFWIWRISKNRLELQHLISRSQKGRALYSRLFHNRLNVGVLAVAVQPRKGISKPVVITEKAGPAVDGPEIVDSPFPDAVCLVDDERSATLPERRVSP